MLLKKDASWFKAEIAPKMGRFSISYRFFEKGDFGSLDQVVFESPQLGGEIGFWSEGWLTLFIWDYVKEKELLNLHLAPEEILERGRAIDEFLKILGAN